MSGSNVQLVYGRMTLALLWSSAWKLANSSQQLSVEQVGRLSLVAPSSIRQIHCSGIWEELAVTASATLTDGASSSMLPAYQPLPPFVMHGPGKFHADWAGTGVIRALFGASAVNITVQASTSSFFITYVSMGFVPSQWNAQLNQKIALSPTLSPASALAPWQNAWNLTNLTMKFTSSAPSVVKLDGAYAILIGDYYQAITITAQTVQCEAFTQQSFSGSVIVNVIPSNSGDIDMGNDVGLPVPPVPVGGVLTIPVYIFASTRFQVKCGKSRVLFDILMGIDFCVFSGLHGRDYCA